MRERFDVDPKELRAAIGPSIGPRRYEVGLDVVERARQAYEDASSLVRLLPDSGGKATFDLWAANRVDLESAGLVARNIEIAEISTDEHLDEFYSHRVEGVTGRFIAAASLRSSS